MSERLPRLSRRFVHQIIECMAEGVFTLDEDGRISSWNPAMEKITGYAAAEALGRQLRHPAVQPLHQPVLPERSEGVRPHETRPIRRQGMPAAPPRRSRCAGHQERAGRPR